MQVLSVFANYGKEDSVHESIGVLASHELLSSMEEDHHHEEVGTWKERKEAGSSTDGNGHSGAGQPLEPQPQPETRNA